VIVSARQPNPCDDPTLADKEALLASLNVKAMKFEVKHTIVHGVDIPIVTELGAPSPWPLTTLSERLQRSIPGDGRRRRPGHGALPHAAVRVRHRVRHQRA